MQKEKFEREEKIRLEELGRKERIKHSNGERKV